MACVGHPAKLAWKSENAFDFIASISSGDIHLTAAQAFGSAWRLQLIATMRITQLLCISCMVITSIDAVEYLIRFETKKAKCLNPPRTARKVESVIRECQDEVRNKLVNGGPSN